MQEILTRLEEPKDIEAIYELVTSAFGDKSVSDLVRGLRASSAWRNLSFVSTHQDVAIAHVSFTRGWIDAPKQLVEALVLSPMSVSPNWQRKGIGSKLIQEALTLLSQRDEPLVFLEGNPAFYSKVGFRPASAVGFRSPSSRIPDLAFQYFPLPKYEEWMTGQFVYPDVFWEHDAVGLRQ